jgi:hypothetical protein
MTQNLYPGYLADVDLSDADKNGRMKASDDDIKGRGASSVEQNAPNPIGSIMLEQVHPSAADQVDTTVPSISGHAKKRALLSLKHKQSKPPADQVMTHIELPPYCGPRSPLDLVVVDIIFGLLFEAFQHASQAAGTGASAGDDTQPLKKAHTPSLKKMLVLK